MPEDPGDAEVSGSGGIDDDGLGLDAWVSDDGPAGVDGRCGDGASPSPRSCPFPCSSSCPSSSRRIVKFNHWLTSCKSAELASR